MESIYRLIGQRRGKNGGQNEGKLIGKLVETLKNGGNINLTIPQPYTGVCYGTILIKSVNCGYKQIVEFALRKKANIAIELTSDKIYLRYRNALDLAANRYNRNEQDANSRKIFEMLKKRSLKLYSSYGLTSLHLDCAIHKNNWTYFRCLARDSAEIKRSISKASPLWPGMTPILIAAKFENVKLVKRLLDLGADPFGRDPDGNTPLHYLSKHDFYDKRFALDGGNILGPMTGESHFHIACRKYPQSSDIVKHYLDQGFSPDLPTWDIFEEYNITGLHIAAEMGSPGLVRLLLEHGADPNQKNPSSYTPIMICSFEMKSYSSIECILTLIDAGSNLEFDFAYWLNLIRRINTEAKESLLSRMRRLDVLNNNLEKDLVCQKLRHDAYLYIVLKNLEDWNEAEHDTRCVKELRSLSADLDLRWILEEKVVINSNFMNKFGRMDTFDFDSYPMYGSLLRLKSKQKLVEYKKKEGKIQQAVPQLQFLFQTYGNLPLLCAEMILWKLNFKELEQFVAAKSSILCDFTSKALSII